MEKKSCIAKQSEMKKYIRDGEKKELRNGKGNLHRKKIEIKKYRRRKLQRQKERSI